MSFEEYIKLRPSDIPIKQIYYPYNLWEDFKAGMWRKIKKTEEECYLHWAVEFTGNDELYGSYMLRVAIDYPLATIHNLSDKSINRRAWIGHAACSIANACPEYIVRSAWGLLTDTQRMQANLRADYAIYLWEKSYAEKTIK